MSLLLQIAQLGDPILRTPAQPVADVHSPAVREIIANLLATLRDSGGVGIAAPQVYVSQRICIVASHPTPRYPHAPRMKPTAMINPVIRSRSRTLEKDWEGCLSIPGIRGLVPRSTDIVVEYTSATGRKRRQSYSGFVARIIQHEYDHLDGIMFLDRVTSSRELITDKEFAKLIGKRGGAKRSSG